MPVATPGSPSLHMLMLRALLAERFKLVARRETRDGPMYALTMARDGGKLKGRAVSDATSRAAAA